MRLGSVLKNWRRMQDIGVREAAKMMGTTASTLSRIERGLPMDGKTLSKILGWLMSEERKR